MFQCCYDINVKVSKEDIEGSIVINDNDDKGRVYYR